MSKYCHVLKHVVSAEWLFLKQQGFVKSLSTRKAYVRFCQQSHTGCLTGQENVGQCHARCGFFCQFFNLKLLLLAIMTSRFKKHLRISNRKDKPGRRNFVCLNMATVSGTRTLWRFIDIVSRWWLNMATVTRNCDGGIIRPHARDRLKH